MKKYKFSDRQLLFLYFLSLISLGVLFLSLPFSYVNGHAAPWIDRLFTAVSAVCVTGLSTFPTGDLSRMGQIFLLLLIQAGGLGYVTFTTLFLFFPGSRFSLRDSSIIQQYFGENQIMQPRYILLNILGLTFGLELFGALILYPGMLRQNVGSPAFSSVFHGISAFCNAGFSLYPDSLTRFSGNSLVLGGVSLMIVTGGLGFMVLWNLGKKLRHGKSVRLMYHTRLMLVLTPLFILGGVCILSDPGRRRCTGAALG